MGSQRHAGRASVVVALAVASIGVGCGVQKASGTIEQGDPGGGAGGNGEGAGGAGGVGSDAPGGAGGATGAIGGAGGRAAPLVLDQPPLCSSDGWCWESPLPQGNDQTSIWVSPDHQLWIVAVDGLISHFDGKLWSGFPAAGSAIQALWGASDQDVWAVGDDILHWNGTEWTAALSPAPARLNALWAVAPDDLWAVGDHGCVMHFDGLSWTLLRMMATETLSSIWAASATDVWAVGSDMVHFDGTTWSSIEGPPLPPGVVPPSGEDFGIPSTLFDQVTFTSVWGSGPNDVWAYGDQAWPTRGASRPELVHYDGSSWRQNTDGNVGGVTQILGTGPNDVWFLTYGPQHFDGTNWKQYTQNAFHLAGATLGPGQIWTVGRDGDIYRLLDDEWDLINPELVNERHCYGGGAAGMWASSGDDVWAAGGGNVMRFDGQRWSVLSSTCFEDVTEYWNAVSGTAANDVWFVGSDWAARGTVRHFDGATLRSVPVPDNTGPLNAVWASNPDDIWAVGPRDVLRWSGGTWTSFPILGAADPQGGPPQMTAIGGSGPNDLWLVGARSMAARWDGRAWSAFQVSTPYVFDFRAVWATGPNDVWLAGNANPLMHWNGSTWSQALASASGVWGTGPTDLWTRTTNGDPNSRTGTIAHWDGATWTTEFLHPAPTYSGAPGAGLFGVAASGDVWAFGDGILAHHSRAGVGGAGGAGVPPPAVDIPTGSCTTLVPGGDWIEGTAIHVQDVAPPSGGDLVDGVYDLVSFLDWAPRSGFRQKRTIQLSQSAMIFDFAADLQDNSGVTTQVRYEAMTRIQRQSVNVRSTCGDLVDFPFGYTVTDDGLVLYSPDPAIRDAPNSEALVYTFRRRGSAGAIVESP